MGGRARVGRPRTMTQKAQENARARNARAAATRASVRSVPYERTSQPNQQPPPQPTQQPDQSLNNEVLASILDRLEKMEQAAAASQPQPAAPKPANQPSASAGNKTTPSVPADPQFEIEQRADPQSDFDTEPAKRPVQEFGTLVGDDVRQKLVNDIRSDKFVEFWELLPNPDRDQSNSFVFAATHSNDVRILKRRQKKFINFQQWNRAYDVYMSIYIETATSRAAMSLLVKDMLTYRKEVESLHVEGKDWFNYDYHFRNDREVNPIRFSTVRHDLLRQYDRRTQSFRGEGVRGEGVRKTNTNQDRHRATNNQVPSGYCRQFHTPETRCTFEHCRYKHVCPRCSRRHPMYNNCKSNQQSQEQNQRQQYQHRNTTTQPITG